MAHRPCSVVVLALVLGCQGRHDDGGATNDPSIGPSGAAPSRDALAAPSVPPPIAGAVEPPSVASADTVAVATTHYIVVRRDGSYMVGVVPEAARTGGGVMVDQLGFGSAVSGVALASALAALPVAEQPDGGGGTGTALALDATPGRPDAARDAGVLGEPATALGPGLYGFALPGDGDPDPDPPLVIADRAAPAHALAFALRAARGGTIAVTRNGDADARAFLLGFTLVGGAVPDLPVVVVTLDATGARVAAQHGATPVGSVFAWTGPADAATVVREVGDARKTAVADPSDVRVWFDGSASVGRVVDVIAALHAAGVDHVVIGDPAEPPANGASRTLGELDKAMVRRVIHGHVARLRYCYEKQLLAHPGLHGTVVATFFLGPDGAVSIVDASGVDPAVASCVAATIRSITFPPTSSGAGGDVRYPFAFHEAGK